MTNNTRNTIVVTVIRHDNPTSSRADVETNALTFTDNVLEYGFPGGPEDVLQKIERFIFKTVGL